MYPYPDMLLLAQLEPCVNPRIKAIVLPAERKKEIRAARALKYAPFVLALLAGPFNSKSRAWANSRPLT
nr:MAG TPA: hypothetical protein [Circoviridae sp.]